MIGPALAGRAAQPREERAPVLPGRYERAHGRGDCLLRAERGQFPRGAARAPRNSRTAVPGRRPAAIPPGERRVDVGRASLLAAAPRDGRVGAAHVRGVRVRLADHHGTSRVHQVAASCGRRHVQFAPQRARRRLPHCCAHDSNVRKRRPPRKRCCSWEPRWRRRALRLGFAEGSWASGVGCVAVGVGLILYLSTGQSTLQLAVPDDKAAG